MKSASLARVSPQHDPAIAGHVSRPPSQRAIRTAEGRGKQARLRGVSRVTLRPRAKPEIGAADDPLEQEANLQRKCEACAQEKEAMHSWERMGDAAYENQGAP